MNLSMINIEHPDITEINQKGYLGKYSDQIVINICKYCRNNIIEDQEVIEFKDDLYCDLDCLCESFTDDPFKHGANKEKA